MPQAWWQVERGDGWRAPALHQRATHASYSLAVTTLAAVNLTLGAVALGTILPRDPIT